MLKPIHVKRYGQHFLQDQNYLKRIIDSVNADPLDLFVEIGPGSGLLTTQLLPLINQLVAIEIDDKLCEHLGKVLEPWRDHLDICRADVLTVDFASLFPQDKSFRVIGNLPYNIATPLLFYLIEYRHLIRDMHVMLQKEVADRLVSRPGIKSYSRLSVMMQYYFNIQHVMDVPPGAFLPPPKVDSSVVRLIPKATPALEAKKLKFFASVVRVAFSQRRKQIINSLRSLNFERKHFDQLAIDATKRPGQLTVNDYVRLSNLDLT